jgi:AmiR/NasT family two-component response regulator
MTTQDANGVDARLVIDQATGVVMAWFGSDAESALGAIVGVSGRRGEPVGHVARRILAAATVNDPTAVAAWLRAQPDVGAIGW